MPTYPITHPAAYQCVHALITSRGFDDVYYSNHFYVQLSATWRHMF